MTLYPLTFHPIFKERVWGGRKLEELFHKPLPPGASIGESWEISDRPGDVSIIANGPLAGKTLHWLVEQSPRELLGSVKSHHGRFPLLVKILDAQAKLSLQVHPPAEQALRLGGEPKTELWYIAAAEPTAELFVGLKHGVTREDFVRKVETGTVADCVQRLPVRSGDAMFLPNGRIHSIGAGLVIFEIQQNSDTTYRVFDWNRMGLEGEPRALHVAESLASINFNDFEPPLIRAEFTNAGQAKVRSLVRDPSFAVELFQAAEGVSLLLPPKRMQILAVTSGKLGVRDGGTAVELSAGGFSLIPASLEHVTLRMETDATFLRVEAGVA